MSRASGTTNRNHKQHARAKSPAAAKRTAGARARQRNGRRSARAGTAVADEPDLLIVESGYLQMPDFDPGDDDDLDDLLKNEI